MDFRLPLSVQTDSLLQLSKQVWSDESNGLNFCFSPFSIYLALGMLTSGSNGRTLDQMLRFLKSTSLDHLNSVGSQLIESVTGTTGINQGEGGPKLSFISGVWIENSCTLKPLFKETVNSIYRGEAEAVDFETKANEVKEKVNKWVEKETNGLIKDLLPPGSINQDTRLVLANALYFKGEWNQEFDPARTEKSEFHLLNGVGSVQVPFMTNYEDQFVSCFDGFKVLQLPYKQATTSKKLWLQYTKQKPSLWISLLRNGIIREEVNKWTHQGTPSVLLLTDGSIDEETRLVLANALYFKGEWNQEFDQTRTREYKFYLLNGVGSVQVPFMTSYEDQFVSCFKGYKVLKLPYKHASTNDRRLSMYIFLPDERDGLGNLIQKASSDSGFLDRHIPKRKVEMGEFRIPKFKISFGFEASEVLKNLGIVLPFDPNEAELDEMVVDQVLLRGDSNRLYVSSFHHKCFVKIDEVGTKAAAASAVCTAFFCCDEEIISTTVDFVADHPFMFFIRDDQSGVVLFMGHILDPL